MPTQVAVVPAGLTRSARHDSPVDRVYRAVPRHPLPTVDLSITLKSKWLRPSARRCFDRLARWRPWLGLGFFITCALYIVVIVVPPSVGRRLAAVGMITGLPGAVLTISQLRYDVVRVLVPTYDVVFFDVVVATTLAVLMAMLGDARVLAFLPAIVANQFNVFIDANTQAVRLTMVTNLVAFLTHVAVAACALLGAIPAFHTVTLLTYNTHSLDSFEYLANGMVTTSAVMLRTLYRKRGVLLGRSKEAVIECVSYRCDLRLQVESPGASSSRRTTLVKSDTAIDSTVQTMRYVPVVPLLRARRVIVPLAFHLLMSTQSRRHILAIRIVFQCLGWIAALLTIASGAASFFIVEDTQDPTASAPLDTLRTASLVLSLLYLVACVALYQRQLLTALCTSFDFIFLSAQLTFIHVALADIFQWQRSSQALLLLTWLWSHWVMCIDALTPIVRDRLGLGPRLVKSTSLSLAVAAGFVSYALIFSHESTRLQDRTLLSAVLLGRRLELRLMSTFYSTYATVLACASRLLWRVLRAAPGELMLLDGPVVYTNPRRRLARTLVQ